MSRNPWSAVKTKRRTPASRRSLHAARSFCITWSNTAGPTPRSPARSISSLWTTTSRARAIDCFRLVASRVTTSSSVSKRAGRAADPVVHGPLAGLGVGDAELARREAEHPARVARQRDLHLRPNSSDTYASHLKNHVYPALGARRIGTITRTDVQSIVTAISAKLAPSTTETVYAVLRAMMQAAVDDDPQVIPVNPCTRINLPKVTRRVVEPLSPAAIMALHRAISPRYRVAVALGAGLGLREGEAFGLTVPRVDFLRRKVHVLTRPSAASSVRT